MTASVRCCAAIAIVACLGSAGAAPAHACAADCDGDCRVSIDELVRAAGIALAQSPSQRCQAADRDGNGQVTIDELLAAVTAALDGCPPGTAPPTATAMPTQTAIDTGPPTPTSTPRPNVIVVDLDDSRADGIDRMPTVQQRLIGEGVRFRNSFVPLSLCCPSRASMLSGLYAVHHGTRLLDGIIGGAHSFRESGMDQRTIAVWMHEAGYATGFFGKYLNAYNEEADRGPGGSFYVPAGWSRWRAFMVERYGGRDGLDYELVDESGGRTAYTDHSSDAQYSTNVLGAELRRFIADAVAGGTPFYAVWTPYASHSDLPTYQPIPAQQYKNTLADIPLWRPPNWNEQDLSDKPRWLQELRQVFYAPGVTDVVRHHAYETLLSVDDEIGLLLQQLAALGVDDRTVIVLTSDNGTAWGENHLFLQFKSCPYEACLRVPLVVRYPRGLGGVPRDSDTPVLSIDVPVTVADLAGVRIPTVVDGHSFLPALAADVAPLRDDFLLEHWSDPRYATLQFNAVPLDGDRIRVYYGPWPKMSQAFEFDADGVVSPGNLAVPIQMTPEGQAQMLGTAITSAVPKAVVRRDGAKLVIADQTESVGVALMDEVDQAASIQVTYPTPDYFGVRDVANGFTYVEHATGELELYDLTADPWQLENKAGDPAYTATQARLAARTRELLR